MNRRKASDHDAVFVEDNFVDFVIFELMNLKGAAAKVDEARSGSDIPRIHLLHPIHCVRRPVLGRVAAGTPDSEGGQAVHDRPAQPKAGQVAVVIDV